MSQRIKIAYVDHAAEVGGGAEEALVDLLRFIDRERFEPILIVAERTDWLRNVDLDGVAIHHVFDPDAELFGKSRQSLGRFRNTASSLAMSIKPVRRIARAIRESGADIVHTNSLKAHMLGGMAARLTSRRLIWDVRDILETGAAKRMLLWAAGLCKPHIVAMSGAVAENLSAARRPFTVVHGGRSPEHYVADGSPEAVAAELGLGPEHEKLAVVARLTPWKGHMLLLDAFASIHRERPQARLLVIGDTTFWEESYRDDLKKRAAKIGCADAVLWLGFRDDVATILAMSDMLVLPSFYEPFGIVIVEAMLAGKPVIAMDSGGPPEIVSDGETGIIAKTGSAGHLADAIASLLEDPARLRAMGEAGRQRAITHFDIRQAVRKIETIYEEMMNGSR